MKSLLSLLALLLSSQALAAPVALQCNERRNMIFKGVRSITIDGDKITLVDEKERGAYVGYAGVLDHVTPGYATEYRLDWGCLVTIPEELLSGKVKEATIQLSTYDYPYEGVECSLAR